jgi:MAX-like protein X
MTMAEKRAGSSEGMMALRRKAPEKETIHSGHFMVSDFEAEAQDDGDELAVPLPEEEVVVKPVQVRATIPPPPPQQLSIETSLTKLFQCMSLAYR